MDPVISVGWWLLVWNKTGIPVVSCDLYSSGSYQGEGECHLPCWHHAV